MNLYQINNEVQNALQIEDAEEREYLMSQLTLNLQDQVEELTKDIINSEAHAVAVDDEIKRLTERKKSYLEHAESIKGYILSSMQKNGLKKAEFVNFTVSVAKTPDKVVIENEALVPADFWNEKVTHTIDKMKLKEALKDGEIEGAKLQGGSALRIK